MSVMVYSSQKIQKIHLSLFTASDDICIAEYVLCLLQHWCVNIKNTLKYCLCVCMCKCVHMYSVITIQMIMSDLLCHNWKASVICICFPRKN